MTEQSERLTDKFNVEHIRENGSRRHVISYSGIVSKKNWNGELFCTDWCAEEFCEHNVATILRCAEHGQDAAELCPTPRAKNWLKSDAGRAALLKTGETR